LGEGTYALLLTFFDANVIGEFVVMLLALTLIEELPAPEPLVALFAKRDGEEALLLSRCAV
jgi:hypothetical protein